MAVFNLKLLIVKVNKLDVCGRPLFANPITYIDSLTLYFLCIDLFINLYSANRKQTNNHNVYIHVHCTAYIHTCTCLCDTNTYINTHTHTRYKYTHAHKWHTHVHAQSMHVFVKWVLLNYVKYNYQAQTVTYCTHWSNM